MRIALYARVSTEEQSLHGLSIDAQLAALRNYAPDAVGEYVDSGVSGRLPIKKRPELQRLLRDIEAGKIDLVAFTKLDRWTRNIREYYKAQDVLDAHHVAWKAIHEDYGTQTAAEILKTNIMLAVGQDESLRTSERVKAVFEDKRRKGLAVNGHMPPGISYNGGNLIKNDDAPKVRELFDYFISSRSLRATAARAETVLGHHYTSPGIRHLLSNERYLDTGIVPPDIWTATQSILSTHGTRTVIPDRVYLFSGLLVCPICGGKLTARTCKSGKGSYVYYHCSRASKQQTCPSRVSVREDKLEVYLRKHLLKEVAERNVRITQKQKKPVDVSTLQRKLSRLTDLYVEGSIDKEEYDRRAEPIRDAIKTAKSAPSQTDTEQIMTFLDAYLALQKTSKKSFWSYLVKSITPTENGYKIVLN